MSNQEGEIARRRRRRQRWALLLLALVNVLLWVALA
jgi:predicted nucleic acid-binding Zn ribbon protein